MPDKHIHHMPIFPDNTGVTENDIELSDNFEEVGGLVIKFKNNCDQSLFAVCDSLMYCIRGDGNEEPNRILLRPFGVEVETQCRREPYKIWYDAPVPGLFIYENVNFPEAEELDYGISSSDLTLYEKFPLLKYVDTMVLDTLRFEWQSTKPIDETEDAFIAWLNIDESRITKINTLRKDFFIPSPVSEENLNSINPPFIASGKKIVLPLTSEEKQFIFRVLNSNGNLVEPMSYFKAINDCEFYESDMTAHPIIKILNADETQYTYKVLDRLST